MQILSAHLLNRIAVEPATKIRAAEATLKGEYSSLAVEILRTAADADHLSDLWSGSSNKTTGRNSIHSFVRQTILKIFSFLNHSFFAT